jgi:NaMN:DMB phosphoribosyltransferase
MKPVTTRALQILESTMELSMRPKSGDRQKLIARVIREVADRLCTDWGELEDPIEILREIADEVEAL